MRTEDIMIRETEFLSESEEEETLNSAFENNNLKFTEVTKLSKIKTNKFTNDSNTLSIPDVINPFSLFSLFFIKEIMGEIEKQTNIYQLQHFEEYNAKNYTFKSSLSTYCKITTQEIYAYLACNIIMGICRCSNYKDHWSERNHLGNSIKKFMSYNKCKYLHKFKHLNVNKEQDNFPLHKVKLLEKVISNLGRHYISNKYLSLDEIIIPFYGRSKLSVYCSMKPEKWGFKSYTLCDSINSYCLVLCIYYGSSFKELYKSRYNDLFKSSITKDMLRNYLNQNFSLFIDNYYNSVYLSDYFIEKGVYFTGILNFTIKDKLNINKIVFWINQKKKMSITISKMRK